MMHKYIKKLPNDIIQHIISYTYNFQSKILLNDIISYIETRKTIYYNYFNLYIDLNEYKYLLINDLISYVKEIYEDEKKNTYDNYLYDESDNKYLYDYNIFTRLYKLYMLKNKPSFYIKKIIINLFKRNRIKSKINILWGLFSPIERVLFIEDKILYYNIE